MKLSEMAFAKKTYGMHPNIKFAPGRLVHYAMLEYGRFDEKSIDGTFSSKPLNDLITVWENIEAADKVNDFDKLGEAEEEQDRIMRDIPGDWSLKGAVSGLAEALVTGRDIETHTRNAVTIVTEEMLMAVSTKKADVHKLLFQLIQKYPA